MSDYAKIAAALRFTASEITNCNMVELSMRTLVDGAVAIEELMTQVKDKDYLIQQQADEIERLQRDVKKQQEKMFELAKLLPKRGEWTEENRRPRSSQFVCSVCHRTAYDPQPTRDKAWRKRCRYSYCPNCGANME